MATAIQIHSLTLPPPSSCSPRSRSIPGDDLTVLRRRRRPPRRPLLRLLASLEPSPVEVIGTGSRKDALIDFCLSNPMISSSRLRFWTVHSRNSQKVQLLQRTHGTEMVLRDLEFPLSLLPCPPATILVASAGLGEDHIAAMELLNSVKSAGGLAVTILLRPFSFEGQKRLAEVDDLVTKLQECSNLYIAVEADSLLTAKMKTLAEALDCVNKAVFLAMHTIAILMSEAYLKVLCAPDGQTKEVKTFEVSQLLDTHRDARVGYGAGYNTKAAIKDAVIGSPFLCGRLKDFDGVVLFTLTSSSDMEKHDITSSILMLRKFTEYTGDILFSRTREPNLELNLVVATVLLVGFEGQTVPQRKSFLSALALHFPSIVSLFRGNSLPEGTTSVGSNSEPAFVVTSQSGSERLSSYLESSDLDANFEDKKDEDFSGTDEDSSPINCQPGTENKYNHSNGGARKGKDGNFSSSAGLHIAQLWAKERAAYLRTNQIDTMKNFTLPVGVKSSTRLCSNDVAVSEFPLLESSSMMSAESQSAMDGLPDKSLEVITGVYDSALGLVRGRKPDEPRKRGLICERAASMLESERESAESWTPIIEMQYRGGTYRGRCQGGLPEGKGCLIFPDGSFYDGMWHYGKKSSQGTFCYGNGDVFQGAWRDDLMHGKGWFYFHTGDRWFANFWNGRANGEGRFYSNDGSIFFGCFQDGWRHGEGLCIDVDGSGWREIWEEGVLLSRTQLEKGADA